MSEGLWAIFYEDASVPPEVFMGCGAEEAAKAAYEERRTNWNCWLLVAVDGPN